MKPFRATAHMTRIIWLCVLLVSYSGFAHPQGSLPHSIHADAALMEVELHHHPENILYLSPGLSDSLDNLLHSSCPAGAVCCGSWLAATEVLIPALSLEKLYSISRSLSVVLPIYHPPPRSLDV